MGVMNLRAICPNCGGKIHTQPKGLGHLTWARSGPLVQTGKRCQWCGIALTGKVGLDNVAVATAPARGTAAPAVEQVTTTVTEPGIDERIVALLEAEGPTTIKDIRARLGASASELIGAQTRLSKQIKMTGMGKRARFELR